MSFLAYRERGAVRGTTTFGEQQGLQEGIANCTMRQFQSLRRRTPERRDKMKTNGKHEVIAQVGWPVLVLAAFLAVALAVPSALHADGVALPPPTVVGVISGGIPNGQIDVTLDNFGSLTGTWSYGAYGSSPGGTTTATMTASYNNGVATISGFGASTGAAESSAPPVGSSLDVYIYFEVVVPGGSVPVPVIYSGAGNTSASATCSGLSPLTSCAYAYANFSGDGITSAPYALNACSPSCADEASSFSGSLDGIVYSNPEFPGEADWFEVSFLGGSGGPWIGPGGWSATVDPTVVIDPAFLASNPGYSLEIDPNPPSTSPVPEPDTLALLGTGMIGFVGVVRRRMSR
jgi:hypothetical protein